MAEGGSTAAGMGETASTETRLPPFAPFNDPAFTVLWLATVLSNVGTWMHGVGADWFMTTLAPSPLMVTLVQTATTLPHNLGLPTDGI